MTWPFLFVAALYAISPVTVSVHPAMGFAPGVVRVRAIIEKDPQNRALTLEAILEHAFSVRSTFFQIDGAQRQRVFTPTHRCICWYDLPAGEYEAVATLTRIEDGEERRYISRQPFHVLGEPEQF